MAYVALYRRWRPENFADLVGQEHISRTLSRAVTAGRMSHAYLFTGSRGTGKTSTAKILARALNCAKGPTLTPCGVCDSCRSIGDGSSMDVFEIDAASNRGIDEIRDLRESVKFAPTVGHYKIYIIDEVHMLTAEAFNALLKTLEEPPARVIFILATTEPHKVPATIQSRCQRYDFHRITVTEIRNRLIYVCKESGIAAEEDALGMIAVQADGGMRDALSILDQCTALVEGTLTAEHVQEALGLVGRMWIHKMAVQIAERNAAALITQLGELLQNGRELKQILAELSLYFRSLMIVGVGGAISAAELHTEQQEELRQTAARFTQEEIMAILRRLNETVQELRWTPQPRIAAETMLIALCRAAELSAPGTAPPAAALGNADAARIARLEAQVEQLTERLATGGHAAPAGIAGAGMLPPEEKETKPAQRSATALRSKGDAGGTRRLDMALWKRFQAALPQRSKLAVPLLSGAVYEGMTETQFFIRPSSDMARDYIAKRHRSVFEEVMAELVGHPVTLVCTGGEEEHVPPAPTATEPEYPAPVAELLRIAGEGARVEEITTPVKPRAHKASHAASSAADDGFCKAYGRAPDEEAEMFMDDELPPDENT